MGVVSTISFTHWPKQASWLHRRVRVCFNHDTSQTLDGRIVRDDDEAPFRTIIALDNGRLIEASECQYQPIIDPTEAPQP